MVSVLVSDAHVKQKTSDFLRLIVRDTIEKGAGKDFQADAAFVESLLHSQLHSGLLTTLGFTLAKHHREN